MSKIKIGNRLIGKGRRPFIIAEAGMNHNGKLSLAYEMIKVAKKADADVIKFQTFKASEFIANKDLTYTYRSQGKVITESMLKMFARYEFSEREWYLIKKMCDAEKILFLSTPQNPSDLYLLLKIGISAIKVGSDDFTNTPLIKTYAKTKLPLILSCGMSDFTEIKETLKVINFKKYPLVLMLCTSEYPVPSEHVNILRLKILSRAFPNTVLGFSDHTRGVIASSLAVALGASVFEKHFTLDNNLPGPDHWFSESPDGLESWVKTIRSAYIMMGDAVIRPTIAEKKMRTLARRSIVAISDINKGRELDINNIRLGRPGSGIAPKYFDDVLGSNAIKKIKAGSVLRWGDFK